jgi:DNA-directed RNA polymerase beta' subunit
MSLYKELSYINQDIDKIIGIQFSISSPDEIRNKSVAEIKLTETFSGNEPVINGLFDPRMGVIEHDRKCATCGQINTFCPGHFGHINLPRPVYYIQFLPIVMKILKCVCWRCSSLLANRDIPEVKILLSKKISNMKKFEEIHKYCNSKNKKCYVCSPNGTRQPDRFVKEPFLKVFGEFKSIESNEKSFKKFFPVEEVERIFRNITDVDCETLGFSRNWCRPEWMICSVFPVPPPCVRPSVKNDSGQRSEDDLTHKLCDIIKTKNTLQAKIDSGSSIDEWTQILQYHIITFVDNESSGIPPAQQRSGRPIKSVTQRLKSKEGRIRGNLMGKRVDFSARSVITPDPNISIDQLGVPLQIAMNLTFPEIVNDYNKKRLYTLLVNGPDVYPGAKLLRQVKNNNRTIRLKYADRESLVLQNGDVLERHLIDDDIVLFNRQPSLHKMSMMAHRIKIIIPPEGTAYSTFRLNVSVTGPYNADFDGDEMNMHVPQSLQTRLELKEIASVQYQIISPREVKPVIGIVQDTLLGVFKITNNNAFVTKGRMMNLMMWNSLFEGTLPEPEITLPYARWSGKQILSTIIPDGINIIMDNGMLDAPNKDKIVKIEKGMIIQGVIDDKIYKGKSKGLIHSIYNDYGPIICKNFLDDTQNIITNWLTGTSHSVGISDLIADNYTKEKLRKVIIDMKVDVDVIIEHLHLNIFENASGRSNDEHFEMLVNQKLNKAIEQAGKIGLNHLDKYNRMTNMVKSGSKGKPTNVSQMIAALGQQNVDGKRITYGFTDRTLPHYTKYDDGSESRGFVENSFMDGLTPQEFFFHAMGGREGIIDTAVKSVTGDTPIIIIENGKSKRVLIGDWIDGHLDNIDNKESVKYYPEDRNLELLNLTDKVYIPTGDEDGNVTWGELTAVTRHDPGTELYEINTLSGRNVIVTASKSLLIYNKKTKKFIEKLTTDVVIGDIVPVISELPKPPVIIDSFDMSEYFPKNEYVYGTEYHKADLLTVEAQGDNYRIETGWWQANNNNKFTLPYPSKARFQRALVRSNTENIKEGCIYPFHASRDTCRIPDTFELNYQNGIFIGLFLADGNTDTKAGSIQISKKEEGVQNFIRNWFDTYKITHRTIAHDRDIGKTYGVIGSSTLLCRFLDKFVGIGSANKHVPDIAFTAPDDFIKGLLNGYISGDGTIGRCSIDVGSVSSRLIYGISALLTRIGIFCKITKSQQKSNNLGTTNILPMYTIFIRSKWGSIFRDNIDLINNDKNEKLKNIKFTLSHINFKDQNNVVLDEIIEITKIGIEKYPKVYDVTVPSTLNFVIENNLILQDTSETGYLQRKLVKAMEDYKVFTDLTVRNATGNIIQFLYGEDGMESVKLETQVIPTLNMDMQKIIEEYKFTDHELFEAFLEEKTIKEMKTDTEWYEKLAEHFNEIVDDKNYILNNIFIGGRELDIYNPVPIIRIINKAISAYHIDDDTTRTKRLSDINPLYVLNTIQKLEDTLKINDYNKGNKLLLMVLKTYLSPKVVIKRRRLSRLSFDYIIVHIKSKYFEAFVNPGEMVGAVAAQSIGEPCTQLTLNSIAYNTDILIRETSTNTIMKVKIGEFIDTYIENPIHPENIENHPNDTTLKYTRDKNEYQIISLNSDSILEWKNIEAVTRHPVINADGTNTMLEIKTRMGRTVTATKAKSFLTRVDNKIVATAGDELKIGDKVPIMIKFPELKDLRRTINPKDYFTKEECIEYEIKDELLLLDEGLGIIIGKYLNCYCWDTLYEYCDKKHINYKWLVELIIKLCNIGNTRCIPYIALTANLEFSKGILKGYYYYNNINNNSFYIWDNSIYTCSLYSELLDGFINILSLFNILSRKKQIIINNEKQYELFIENKYIQKLIHVLELDIDDIQYDQLREYFDTYNENDIIPGNKLHCIEDSDIHRSKLKNLIDSGKIDVDSEDYKIINDILEENVFFDEIIEINEVENKFKYAYDLTVADTRTFSIFNGLQVYDTFHFAGISSKSNVTRGVPRIKELLSVTKNIKSPSLKIFPKKDIIENRDKSLSLLNKLETTRLRELVLSSRIYYDPDDLTTNVEDDISFIKIYQEFNDLNPQICNSNEDSPWLLRFEFNRELMMEKEINMDDIHYSIFNEYDDNIKCMYSDDNANKLIFRIRVKDKISEDDVYTYKVLENNILDKIVIKGFKNIDKVNLEKNKTTRYINGESINIVEWILDTQGTNLDEILNHPDVDSFRSISNDINEINEVLGIEAARYALYIELKEILQDTYVNYRHISLLIDTMTNKGNLMSIDRHGINRADIGPLAKSSFEETTDMLVKASIFGEYDKINGVSANIMLGQLAPCGTGDSEVLFDLEALRDNMKEKQYDVLEYEDYEREMDAQLHSDFQCTDENLDFSINISDKIRPSMKLSVNEITVK